MRPIVCSVLAAATALSAAAPSAAAADLNGFLGGFERTCSGTERFTRYMFSLGEKYTTSGDLRKRILVPAAFRTAVGKETVTDKGEYMDISVPLRGTYRGLPVSRLDFSLGNENGIYTVAIVFDASVKAVEAALGPNVARAQKTLPLQYPNRVPSIEILPENRGAKLSCILSD